MVKLPWPFAAAALRNRIAEPACSGHVSVITPPVVPLVIPPPHHPTCLCRRRLAAGLLLGCGAALLLAPGARAADDDEITAVSARVSDDYVRAKRADGSFEPESYAFGEGGRWGGLLHDDTIDKVDFREVAQTVAAPLASQNYVPARDPDTTKFLIMVYWGTTAGATGASTSSPYMALQGAQAMPTAPPPPPAGPSQSATRPPGGVKSEPAPGFDGMLTVVMMANHQRDRTTALNATLLGYDAELLATRDYAFGAQLARKQDVVAELEDSRYFVVLMAYDFPLLLKEKKHKLVWETRFSIRQRSNDFERRLASMAQEAARYFGQDSHGVVRKPIREGTVKLDEMKVIGVVPEKDVNR